jgi:integrase/recombinase XerD
MSVLLDKFIEWMKIRGYSETTAVSRRRLLGYFIAWAEERGVVRPNEVTKPMIERYQRYLYHYRKQNGKPMTFRSQHTQLLPVRAWFKWLARNNYLLYNPASEMELPRLEQRLPKHVLSASQAEAILRVPDATTPLGIRDRSILEVFYSTGIRRMEMANLEVYNVNFDRGTLMVRQGKGKKDRLIPIGGRALKWVEKYLYEVRPTLTLDLNEPAMFISIEGGAVTSSHIAHIVSKCIEASDQGITGSCHLFRHTMATLMLENGADIRFVQAMLGHAHLDTTQIYTKVAINKLKEIHNATHPAKEKRDDAADEISDDETRDETGTAADSSDDDDDNAAGTPVKAK